MTDEKASQPADKLPRGMRKAARGWEIDLDYPVEHDGHTVETLTLARPTSGDLEIMARESGDDDDDVAGLVAMNNMLARLLGLTEDEERTIDGEDWSRMLGVIKPHLEKLQRGGLI